jgi:hypothetical protein
MSQGTYLLNHPDSLIIHNYPKILTRCDFTYIRLGLHQKIYVKGRNQKYFTASKKGANLATHHFKAKNSASAILSGAAEFYYLICCKRQVIVTINLECL